MRISVLHKYLFLGLMVTYLLLLIAVAFGFGEELKDTAFLFLLFNLTVSILFFILIKLKGDYVYSLVFYLVYIGVYIVKSIMQYFYGLDSIYVLVTIRNAILPEAYIDTLYFISIGHAIISITLVLLSVISRRETIVLKEVNMGNAKINILFFFLVAYIAFSSIIMLKFGVAVMGSEGVQLPFKLSGIFFYTRTIVLPLILLYFIQLGLVKGDASIFRKAVIVLLLLAISEVIVRATKSPFFIFILQFLIMYFLVVSSGLKPKLKIKAKYIIYILMFSLSLWPVIEAYRSMITVGEVELISLTVENKGDFLYILQRLFQRLLGFLQLAGLVSDFSYAHDIGLVFSYDSFSRYYTQSYLGYLQQGHLSSPSLLGVAIILAGEQWFIVFFLFVLLTFFIWKMSSLFTYLNIPIKCFLGVYLFNVIMAGTIDFFIFDVARVFIFALIFEVLFKLARRKVKHGISVRAELDGVHNSL